MVITTKIKPGKNLTNEIFYCRKIPNLYYTFTVITLFHCGNIFGRTCCPKICYSNIVPVPKFFSGRSSEKRLVPVALLLITLSLLIKTERTLSILRGRRLMVTSSLITATAYLALVLVGSLQPFSSSPTAATYLSL